MVSVPSTAVPPLPIARFSVEQYHRMVESGAFTENDRLELIEGWVVQQLAEGPGHEYAVEVRSSYEHSFRWMARAQPGARHADDQRAGAGSDDRTR